MSRPLGLSLQFWTRHAQDIAALEDFENRPPSVPEDDWTKYCKVLELASQQAGDVLIEIRDHALTELKSTVVQTQKSSQGYTYKYWDAWFEFKLRGPGRKASAGLIGAAIDTEPTPGGPGLLVAYVRAKGGEERELRWLDLVRQRGLLDKRDVRSLLYGHAAAVHVEVLSPAADVDVLVANAVAALQRVGPYLTEI